MLRETLNRAAVVDETPHTEPASLQAQVPDSGGRATSDSTAALSADVSPSMHDAPPTTPARQTDPRAPSRWVSSALTLPATVLVVLLSAAGALAQEAPPEEPGPEFLPPVGQNADAGADEDQKSAEPKGRKDKKKLSRKELRERIEALPPGYRQWLADVDALISDDEKMAFLELAEDHQREAFVQRFWAIRDPYGDTTSNEFKKQWYDRLSVARQLFGTVTEDRGRYFMLNGPPDARLPFQCTSATYPLEVWYYRRSERIAYEFTLLFVRKYGRPEYSLWRSSDRLDALVSNMGAQGLGSGASLQDVLEDIYTCRDGQLVIPTINRVLIRPMEYDMLVARIEQPTENPSPEWLATFSAYSTDLPEDADTIAGKVEVNYPSRLKARIAVDVQIELVTEQVEPIDLVGNRSYNLALVGQILREGKLFETFRYNFDIPAPADQPSPPTLPLVFQRRLRPGTYRMLLRAEDVNGRAYFRADEALEVPHLDSPAPDAATTAVLDAAESALTTEVVTLEIVQPIAQMQTGYTRFDTLVTGQDKIAQITFALNDRVRMQKRFAPFSVELDLGPVPRTHTLVATALDAEGKVLASDEMILNQAPNRFDVQLIRPAEGGGEVTGRIEAEAAVTVPEGSFVQKVEFFYNETLLTTVYQEPWSGSVELPASVQLGYVRAVATLADGNSTEDLVYVNAPDYLEEVDIQYVELYVAALDRNGRPIGDLEREEFTISEDGIAQEIRRFEKVDNLPIHMQVMIDVSASMDENLDATRQAALQFFDSAILPRDRGSLITFNDHPRMAVNATNDPKELSGGLAGLKAERGTALYDALIFGLYHLNGVKGQRAILLLSDGKDESSRFSFDATLEYARRAGVAIYPIGLAIKGRDARQARGKLRDFAAETGGSAFFIDSINELDAIYRQIGTELRSRYLITYQSNQSDDSIDFRTIDLKTTRSGVELRTLSGYYP